MHGMAPARRVRAGLAVYPPSQTLEVLVFDEYFRFDTSAFLEALFIPSEKAEVSKRQYSSKAKSSNVHDFSPIIGTVQP